MSQLIMHITFLILKMIFSQSLKILGFGLKEYKHC